MLSFAVGLASLAVTIVIVITTEAEFGYLTRDPAQLFNVPPYAGFLSNMGVLFWMASATVTAFGAALMSTPPDAARARTFLTALTLLSGALCLDDLFVLHERLPVREVFFFFSYAVFLAVTITVFHDLLGRGPTIHLIAAGAFFAVSLGIDLRQEEIEAQIGDIRVLLEDGAKFVGAVFWLNFSWAVTSTHVMSVLRPSGR